MNNKSVSRQVTRKKDAGGRNAYEKGAKLHLHKFSGRKKSWFETRWRAHLPSPAVLLETELKFGFLSTEDNGDR